MNIKSNGLLLVILLFFFGCNSNKQQETANEHVHEHSEHKRHSHECHSHTEEEEEIHFSKQQAKTVGLTMETVALSDFNEVLKVSGQILTSQSDEVTLVATAHGLVNFIQNSLTEGSMITAGKRLLSISAKDLLDEDASINAKMSFEIAQKEYDRANKLHQEQIISTKEFEQIKLKYETAKVTYETQATHTDRNGISISSPIHGYLVQLYVNQGDFVEVGQPLAKISRNKKLQLRAEVSEKDYLYVKNIRSANFKTAYNAHLYKLSDLNGRLLSVGKSGNGQSFFIPVTFEFDNAGDFLSGSFVEVYLLSFALPNCISVPVSALSEEQGLYFVYIQLDEEGYLKQEVKLGQNNGERVQILSGLKTGDKVVTQGVTQLKLAANASVIPEGHSH